MSSRHLVIDFGSTYTKAVLFDLDTTDILGMGYAPSTVDSDVRDGLAHALAAIGAEFKPADAPAHACSSAAGGLRVVVVGLVPTLSLEAAQRAALGAGAKVVGAYGFKLSASDVREISKHAPDILLLAGGTDGGDEEIIVHNAGRLTKSDLSCPVIVAGNKAVADDCEEMLKGAGLTVHVVDNILPEVDKLNVQPVHAKIREIFMDRIVHAKGIDRVGDEINLTDPIMPTPRAILDAAQVLSSGNRGDVVVVDIGGATTDVHSIASGVPRTPGVIQRGLPELQAKRTVEGDLGMRVSAPTVMARAGIADLTDACAALGQPTSTAAFEAYVEKIGHETGFVSDRDGELAMDAAVARAATGLAMARHAGHIKEVFTATGPVPVQEGKDLTDVRMLVGVGGVLAHGKHARFILEAACRHAADPTALVPVEPKFYVDRRYVLFGAGLLAQRFPEQALQIARKHLVAL